MVVHEADRLHERVADRRTDEAELPALQVFAHHPGLRRLRRKVGQRRPPVDDRRSVDEPPEVVSEAAELVLQLEDTRGVIERGLDLEPVPDDARVGEQSLAVIGSEPCDDGGVEAGERGPVALALVQDRRPGEPGLRTLERQKLEQVAVVVRGNTPLLVVVGNEKGVARTGPLATISHGRRVLQPAAVPRIDDG